MAKIDGSLYLRQQQTDRGSTNATLGKDDFMRILMTQLQNQDPLNPMQDKEFISQMTSFSSLEQMMNMSSAMEKFTQAQSMAPVVEYSSMIGREVTFQNIDSETGEPTGQEEGIVQAVSQKDGRIQLEVEDGSVVNVEQILKVSNANSDL
ncbi:flagellar hook assembly protein FlgD [Thalassobacillus hwangdonensis]|uniref:Flagellar hook assembly protein FlgD n=1 Tax=Thalassobacillus hwangdonensis TaxID=546108 RepID=A0ABW3KYN4_9BACI